MPPAEHLELRDPSGSVMADLQAGLATLGPKWGLRQLVDIDADDARNDLGAALGGGALARRPVGARRRGAGARGARSPRGENAAAQFLSAGAARPIRGT